MIIFDEPFGVFGSTILPPLTPFKFTVVPFATMLPLIPSTPATPPFAVALMPFVPLATEPFKAFSFCSFSV